jgi:hypothetical protein
MADGDAGQKPNSSSASRPFSSPGKPPALPRARGSELLPPFIPPWAYRGPPRPDLVVPGKGHVDEELFIELTPAIVRAAVEQAQQAAAANASEEPKPSSTYGEDVDQPVDATLPALPPAMEIQSPTAEAAAPSDSEAAATTTEYVAAVEAAAAGGDRGEGESLPSILSYLEEEEVAEELPSIQSYLLEQHAALPSISEYLATDEASVPETPLDEWPQSPQPTENVEDAQWVARERDAFDWSSSARLTPTAVEQVRADADWEGTNWDSDKPNVTPEDRASADALARALTMIAAKVRAGEIAVPVKPGVTTEAAIAAVLAAMLQKRS